MRALVISGGASKGAFAGGIAEHLIGDRGIHYDIFCGTSTGSLLVPMLAAGDIARIREMYCNVSQSDIFNKCPFRIRHRKDAFRVGFNHPVILWQFLRGRKTFGESHALHDLIRQTITPAHFARIHDGPSEVIITVSNFTRNTVEYKYARDYDYDEFCEWIWISANMIPFMSLVVKDGCEYGDGGFGNWIPIQEAINRGAEEIDVIVLNPRHLTQPTRPAHNAIQLLLRGFHFMLYQIGQDDLNVALLESRFTGIKINLIHTPRLLTENSVVFDRDQMRAWWQEGYDYAKYLYSGDKTEY
jgi:predicted patatin/cPLA2 family phospholipase